MGSAMECLPPSSHTKDDRQYCDREEQEERHGDRPKNEGGYRSTVSVTVDWGDGISGFLEPLRHCARVSPSRR
jgi:hypothetical protein